MDFQRAFDSVNHTLLVKIGVRGKIVRILAQLYYRASMQIKINGQLSSNISITEGVLQGESLSPLLFALFLSDIEEFFRSKGLSGLRLNSQCDVLCLAYADDLAYLADCPLDVNKKLCALL